MENEFTLEEARAVAHVIFGGLYEWWRVYFQKSGCSYQNNNFMVGKFMSWLVSPTGLWELFVKQDCTFFTGKPGKPTDGFFKCNVGTTTSILGTGVGETKALALIRATLNREDVKKLLGESI